MHHVVVDEEIHVVLDVGREEEDGEDTADGLEAGPAVFADQALLFRGGVGLSFSWFVHI